MTTYGVVPLSRDIGMKVTTRNVPTAAINSKQHQLLSAADQSDEKVADPTMNGTSTPPTITSELSHSYIPLTLARSKMQALTNELSTMKAKHLTLLDTVAAKYEVLTQESRTQYEIILNEVKSRATLKLKESRAELESLREQMIDMQEKHSGEEREMKGEMKRIVGDKEKVVKDLEEKEVEVTQLHATHQQDLQTISQRQAEIETLMQTRVPKEEYDALMEEKTQLHATMEQKEKEFQESSTKLQTELDEKIQQLADLTMKLEALTTELSAVNEKQVQTEADLTVARQERDELQAKFDVASAELTANEQALKEAREESTNHKESHDKLKTESEESLTESKRVKDELQIALEVSQGKVTELEQKLIEAGNNSAASSSSSNTGSSSLSSEAEQQLQAKIRNLEAEVNRLNAGGAAVSMNHQYNGEQHSQSSASSSSPPQQPFITEDPSITTSRTTLTTRITSMKSESDSLLTEVTTLENDIKPRAADYKMRVEVYKNDPNRAGNTQERDALKLLKEEIQNQTQKRKEMREKLKVIQSEMEVAQKELEAIPPPPVQPVHVAPVAQANGQSSSFSQQPQSSSSSSSPPSNFIDHALQQKYTVLQSRVSSLESEISELKQTVSNKDESLMNKQKELQVVQSQLETLMNSGDVDSQVRILTEQLSSQREEVSTIQTQHQVRLEELQSNIRTAQKETREKVDELEGMKKELEVMQVNLKQAKEEAERQQKLAQSAAAQAKRASGVGAPAAVAASSSEPSATPSGGVIGGIDPSIVAELESQRASNLTTISEQSSQITTLQQQHESSLAQISTLQIKITSLEQDLVAHQASLIEQLTTKETELKTAHQAQVTALEEKVAEKEKKFEMAKAKAKELHTALKAETATREGLEVQVKERDEKIVGMEVTTKEAVSTMEVLKTDLSARDQTISEKLAAIAELEERKAQLEKDVSFLEVRNVEEIKRRKEFQFKYEDAKGKVRVYARVRPFSKAEVAADEKTLLRPGTNEWTLCINETVKNYQGVVSDNWRPIEFDHVFHFGLDNTKGNATQAEIFEETKIFAELTVQGINCCVFAYGQSGTGKTFTMAGVKPKEENGMTKDLLGLKPRMIDRVYEMKKELKKTHDLEISCYMLEIYLNKLEDVFWKLQTQQKYIGKEKSKWPEPPELKVRVDAKRKVTIDNSIICKFDTAEEMGKWCDEAEMTRRVRKTGLNEESSRSHLIFAIICTSTDKKTGKKTTGKLSLVDLAGSERAEKTNVEGLSKAARAAMMEEGIAINESLRMLKSVFRILGEANKPLAKGAKAEIVQYRGNMLTELMQDSLGGNAKTLMFVNVGPAASNISESVDSLAYGDLVKNITNEKVSADADNEEQIRFLGAQLRAYEAKYGAIE